jgi:hypothetical protein
MRIHLGNSAPPQRNQPDQFNQKLTRRAFGLISSIFIQRSGVQLKPVRGELGPSGATAIFDPAVSAFAADGSSYLVPSAISLSTIKD